MDSLGTLPTQQKRRTDTDQGNSKGSTSGEGVRPRPGCDNHRSSDSTDDLHFIKVLILDLTIDDRGRDGKGPIHNRLDFDLEGVEDAQGTRLHSDEKEVFGFARYIGA
ncbi:hypothetical protein NQZ68_027450 [Dissostichus eleginoides]|nr:hypothetical protein NQZ68_027450 [Dissostichus eleginoides]